MKRKRSCQITIRPGNSIMGQAKGWNMMRVMAGNEALPICPKCGGLPADSDGPRMGKCQCEKA